MWPTKATPRYQTISCRVSEPEYWEIVKKSEELKCSLSEAARSMMFNKEDKNGSL